MLALVDGRPFIGKPSRPEENRVVVFHGCKGGVGTTMVAAETAASLSGRERRVVAVDLDVSRGDLHFHLDVNLRRNTPDIADLVPVQDELDTRVLEQVLSDSASGARLLPSPLHNGAGSSLDSGLVEKTIAALRREFDYVIIDTQPRLDGPTAEAFGSADLLMLVITPEISSVGSARRILESIKGEAPTTALVVNRSLGKSDLLTLEEIESFLELPIESVLPEETPGCRILVDQGKRINHGKSALGKKLGILANRVMLLSPGDNHRPGRDAGSPPGIRQRQGGLSQGR